ncbi:MULTISPECIES: hypothetical protein [Staphylococcus]|uniref:Uncharacterized protein n=1 Tax=Staphylococcus hsinchuensis TaxID=3051183 RepID=A0ABZ3ECB3_9STAP|nr:MULTISPECIES: hypothetical protein [unclassified Staphylococcus]
MISLISAIGSIGTFIMALFYIVSISIQFYQMKIEFIPALGFNQTLLSRDNKNQLYLLNTSARESKHEDFLRLYNLGGGAAKEIKIEIYLDGGKTIQTKYVNILPSKEGYLLPINRWVFDELNKSIDSRTEQSNIKIKISYNHYVSRKTNVITYRAYIDDFNEYNDRDIYELQFV